MSLIPEFILQTTIVRGIRTLRNDHRFVDQLFRNLRQVDIDQIRKFMVDNAIDLTINYPREDLKIPAIVILLRTETEHPQGAYLDDSMGIDDELEVLGYDGGIPPSVQTGTASTSTLSGQGPILFGPKQAVGGTENTIIITNDTEMVSCEFLSAGGGEATVHIVGGTGRGQIRNLVENTPTVVTVEPNWTIVPDATSIFEIRAPAQEILGEPSALYDRRSPQFVERKGSAYQLNYQIQVIGQNPEQTIYLFTILKAILTLSRTFLEGQGVINMKMGATDFLPKNDYVPDFAYMRALNLEFLYHFDTFVVLEGLAEEFNIRLQDSDKVDLISTTLTVGKPAVEVS